MITAIYLAAGSSRRMRKAKLSMDLNQSKVGDLALSVILHSNVIDYVIVVVNQQDNLEWISKSNMARLDSGSGEIIVCPEAARGQSYSLKKGFEIAVTRGADKILICLADQPFITEKLLETLAITEWDEKDDFIASSHHEIVKPPILFRREVYSKVRKLEGDVGAKRLIQKGELYGKKIEFSEEKLFYDIDTEEDYFRILERRD
ncbi:NTP transferase domain-containing protein [Bacillus sp. B1-b2]|uniref:NTP transferase domain-containing protein n=1 Tax=Bacillus sp. B1-b2 TaxID=2653201 RepID=UPI0012626D05|nr:NTP transferase domain-containing protein [Bacillus sp. B1-b2]KAB7671155.1 NTP transferase domain-containing protein [Bacillus sp. B1-b2]